MAAGPEGRWPPIYDAEDLKRQISELASRDDLGAVLFERDLERGGPACQGDVLRFEAGIPVLDEDANPAVMGDTEYWLLTGNTCDFARSVSEVPWTQVVPLVSVGTSLPPGSLAALRRYRTNRRFYIPPWPRSPDAEHRVADLLTPVALHKSALGAHARVVARLSFLGWVLLHACLIRFLARDDGRFDEDDE